MSGQETDKSEDLRNAIDRDIHDILEPISYELDIGERLAKLQKLGIGRAFVHVNADETVRMLHAISLPLNREQTKHVVIFADGEVIITEPIDKLNSFSYSNHLNPSNVPYNFDISDLSKVKRVFHLENVLKSKITTRSLYKDQIPEIAIALKDSLELSLLLKAEQEKALDESSQVVINTVDFFLDRLDAPDAEDLNELDDISYGPEE